MGRAGDGESTASELPRCRHREEVGEGRWRCAHPQLRVDGGVDLRTCIECRAAGVFCDKPAVDMATHVMRNKMPHLLSRVWNLTRALGAFVQDGARTVDKAQYARRLARCDACPERWNDDCKICGCRLSLKARGRAFTCPLGHWIGVGDDPAPAASGEEPREGAPREG